MLVFPDETKQLKMGLQTHTNFRNWNQALGPLGPSQHLFLSDTIAFALWLGSSCAWSSFPTDASCSNSRQIECKGSASNGTISSIFQPFGQMSRNA